MTLNNDRNKSLLEIHIAVFLFGITGLFGKFIFLNPLIIVLGRVFFSSIFLFFWLLISKKGFMINNKKDYSSLAKMGILLAIHWVAFFSSIQLSNVAIGLLTFSTFPVFVTVFNFIIDKSKIKKSEIIYGIITIIGLSLILPLDQDNSNIFLGGSIGVFAGAVYAIYTISNVGLVKKYSGMKVAFYEHIVSTVVLVPFLFILKPEVVLKDIGLLILLGTVFTGIGHSLFINGLKNIDAYLAGMITMLEPMYAVFLAWLLLGETITMKVAIGGIIILSTVFMSSRE